MVVITPRRYQIRYRHVKWQVLLSSDPDELEDAAIAGIIIDSRSLDIELVTLEVAAESTILRETTNDPGCSRGDIYGLIRSARTEPMAFATGSTGFFWSSSSTSLFSWATLPLSEGSEISDIESKFEAPKGMTGFFGFGFTAAIVVAGTDLSALVAAGRN